MLIIKGSMNKIFGLLSILLLLSGCAESFALLGTSVGSASNGRIIQSSVNSAISYGVKKQTGKTPLEHAIAYAEENNPGKKRETCISFIERTRSEFCTVINKKISFTKNTLVENKLEIVQKLPKINKIKKVSLIEQIAKKSIIYNRR